jgi:hypothetical protein
MRYRRIGDVLWMAALTTGALGCATNESPDTLDAQQETWRAQEPERYVVQTCTLDIEPPGCVRAVIDAQGVVAIEERIFDPGAPGWELIVYRGRPLDDMFDRVRACVKEGCTVDELQYDGDFGYVQTYSLECADSETEGRWVACFEPDATSLEDCDDTP